MNHTFSITENICILLLLTLMFVMLKLGGVAPVAGWSWWLVTLPTWGPLLAAVLIAGSIAVMVVTAMALWAFYNTRKAADSYQDLKTQLDDLRIRRDKAFGGSD